jgi:RNA-directed DNA polymerase
MSGAAELLACKDQADLAAFLGATRAALRLHLYSVASRPYTVFSIPKAAGGSRLIAAPPPMIKVWQRRLLPALNALYVAKAGVNGFVKGRGILRNALPHVAARLVLNLDIEDFFPSIHFGRVRGVFLKPPFTLPTSVATTLATLCTFDGKLPQGAPTSPVISNFVCRRLDNELRKLAAKTKCNQSRFADDITFSTNETTFSPRLVKRWSTINRNVELGDELVGILAAHDFELKRGKTRIQSHNDRQVVTGLTVNCKVNVQQAFVRRLRAILHGIATNGLPASEAKFAALDKTRTTRLSSSPSLIQHIEGKFAFLRLVRGNDDSIYARYAIAAHRLGALRYTPILQGRSIRCKAFVPEALWIVVGRDASGIEISQGTAFTLAGVGIVTAAHVFDDRGAGIAWALIRATAPYEEVPVHQWKTLKGLDLAILGSNARSHARLQRSGTGLEGGTLTAIGYPNWHSTADAPMIAHTSIAQVKTIGAVRWNGLHHPLVSGASGGPVLGEDGLVVGVIVSSVTSPVLPNAFISIKDVDAVLSEESKDI